MVRRAFQWGIASLWVVTALVAVSSVGIGLHWWAYVQSPLPDAAPFLNPAPPSDLVEIDFAVQRGSIENPPFADPSVEHVANSMRVIGLVVDGQAYAYSVKALSIPRDRIYTGEVPMLARRHVVNHLLGDTAVCVTYCDITGCARVFKMDHQSRLLPMVVGGASNARMVLVFADKNYLQHSKKIPLSDHPFEITSWGDWVSRHPTSQIYLGG